MPLIRNKRGSADKTGGDKSPARSVSKPVRDNDKPQTSARKVVPSGELAEVLNVFQKNVPGTVFISSNRPNHGRITTNILALDVALAGGLKRSRAAMIYGERSTGKTTITLKAMAEVQRRYPDKFVVAIDIEGTVDKSWFKMLGGDPERLIIVEPDSGEIAVDTADALIRTGDVMGMFVDSIAMLSPQAEIDASAEDNQMAIQARMVGRFLRKINQALLVGRKAGHYPLVILLNQFRSKVGLVFGDPRTLPGGKALEFVTSQQLETKNKEHRDSNDLVVFNEHTVVITKDKTGGRIKEAKFKLIRDESQGAPVGWIDQHKTILSMGAKVDVVKGRTVDGAGSFKSDELFRQWCVENPDKERKICHEIIDRYRKLWNIED